MDFDFLGFDDSDKEPPDWYSAFLRSFPEHTNFAFSGGGNDTESVTVVPFLYYGILAAPVVAIILYAMGGLRGVPFLGGWFLSAFLALFLHMAVCVLYALLTSGATLKRLRERHGAWIDYRDAKTREFEQARAASKKREENSFLNELIAEGENLRLAPMRAAQARAQRLAALELALQEAFNRYRFARDVTGTADLNALRQNFLREVNARPLFPAEDMALLATTQNRETRLLLPPSTA